MENRKNIAILGSTGSIGTQTLDVISEYPDRLYPSLLTANRNVDLLIEQALKFKPRRVVIAQSDCYTKLRDTLAGEPIEVMCGQQAIADAAAADDVDIVVTAMVGYSGLAPTISAIKAGKTIALANKETLVVAGELITRLVKQYGSRLVPVDSEHSAIFQCLVGEDPESVDKLILTASGGPFRTRPKEELYGVTRADALNHPNWSMGAKVTIDSASMMNKGFEMIEARWLFGIPSERIEIVVHPQSIVHSMVAYSDGSVKAQLGLPDMRLPIRYALNYPERLPSACRKMSVADYANLTFEAPDREVSVARHGFRCHPPWRQRAVCAQCSQRDCRGGFSCRPHRVHADAGSGGGGSGSQPVYRQPNIRRLCCDQCRDKKNCRRIDKIRIYTPTTNGIYIFNKSGTTDSGVWLADNSA